ncbi:MAG: NifU family protein, partial [Microscillaceae bacterium]|nr:NifU family protein [Microscillaceae bacterium]MDW8461990.1 NifU family protein [Cytophagales bacterium]
MQTQAKKYITLYTEANPNPNSMKFVANYMLVPEGTTFDFPDRESAQEAPIAQALFEFSYVRRVFLMNNFITITKDEQADWFEIVPELKKFIKTYLEEEKPLLSRNLVQNFETETNSQDSEVVRKIKNILEEYVRPAVETDGGAIHFRSFEEGVVKVQLQGSCSGCPSSTLTLKAGIENLLKRMVPEVT